MDHPRGSGDYGNASQRLATSVAIILLLGLVEWIVLEARFGFGLKDAARALLAVLVSCGALGVGVGAVSAVLGRRGRFPGIEVALPVAVWIALYGQTRLGELSGLRIAATATVGLVAVVLLWGIGRRLPFATRPQVHWPLVAAFVAIGGIWLAPKATDLIGGAVAVGVAIAALLLAVAAARGRAAQAAAFGAMALFAIVVLAWRVPAVRPDTTPLPGSTSVLLVTIDTLRADRVGAYGYEDARTPNLDAFAANGTLFRSVVAPSVYTCPSHTSILTGLLPATHGTLFNWIRIPPGHPTLADVLDEHGYVTGAFVSSYTARDDLCGLVSRFRSYDDNLSEVRLLPEKAFRLTLLRPAKRALIRSGRNFEPRYRKASNTVDVAIDWLERNADRPYFAWVHLFDPHIPYDPPADFLDEAQRGYDGPVSGLWYYLDEGEQEAIARSDDGMQRMLALYDAEVSYADAQLGRLLDAARRLTPDDDLVVVVASDHGESMGEHDLYWERDLYDPSLLVPLIIDVPASVGPTRPEVGTQVQLIDIAPTLLDLLEYPVPPDLDGASLLPVLAASDPNPARPAFSAIYANEKEGTLDGYAVRDGEWKLIWRPSTGAETLTLAEEEELYNVLLDPAELENLSSSPPALVEQLRLVIGARLEHQTGEEVSLDPAQEERLRSLGYIK